MSTAWGRVRSLRSSHVLLALLYLVGIVWFCSSNLAWGGYDFQLGIWTTAQHLLRGENPYQSSFYQVPFQGNVPLWLPSILGLFWPLGLLPLRQAANVWLLLSIGGLCLLLFLLQRHLRQPGRWFLAALVLTLVFPPVLSSLFQGQVTPLVVLGWVAAGLLAERSRFFLAGIVVVLALTKPQLGFLALPGLCLWTWRAGGLRAVSTLTLGALMALAALLGPLVVRQPALPAAFVGDLFYQSHRSIEASTRVLSQPSLFRLPILTDAPLTNVLWLVALCAAAGATLWLWWRSAPLPALGGSLLLTLLVSPYLFSYDFVLAVPLAAYLSARTDRPMSRWALALAYAVTWSASVWMRARTDNLDQQYWWMPWLFLLVAAWTSYWRQERRRGNAAPSDEVSLT